MQHGNQRPPPALAPLIRPALRLLRAAVLAMILAPASWAQDRLELANDSPNPWTLAIVLGTREGRGSVVVQEKFSGRTLAKLRDAADRISLRPATSYILTFQREDGIFSRNFIFQDGQGRYVEYCFYNEFKPSKQLNLDLVNHRVGVQASIVDPSHLDAKLREAIALEGDRLAIHPPDLGWNSLFPHLAKPLIESARLFDK